MAPRSICSTCPARSFAATPLCGNPFGAFRSIIASRSGQTVILRFVASSRFSCRAPHSILDEIKSLPSQRLRALTRGGNDNDHSENFNYDLESVLGAVVAGFALLTAL